MDQFLQGSPNPTNMIPSLLQAMLGPLQSYFQQMQLPQQIQEALQQLPPGAPAPPAGGWGQQLQQNPQIQQMFNPLQQWGQQMQPVANAFKQMAGYTPTSNPWVNAMPTGFSQAFMNRPPIPPSLVGSQTAPQGTPTMGTNQGYYGPQGNPNQPVAAPRFEIPRNETPSPALNPSPSIPPGGPYPYPLPPDNLGRPYPPTWPGTLSPNGPGTGPAPTGGWNPNSPPYPWDPTRGY